MKHDIFFDEATHTYLVDGQEVPSVTEILKPLHRSYGSIAPGILESAAERGSAVHEACEAIDLDLEPEIDDYIEGYVRAYLDWKSIHDPKWEMIEQTVLGESIKGVVVDYAGTIDRCGKVDGEEAVVDIKTSQPTKEALVSVCIQTFAYAWCVSQEPKKVRRIGLFLKADGTFRHLDCQKYEEKYDIDPGWVFGNLLDQHQMITRLLATGKGRG